MAGSPGWQIGAGCWQAAAGPCHVDLPRRLLECPPRVAMGSPERERSKSKARKEAPIPFMT